MSDSIITVEGLGKRYRIQHQQDRQQYVALRDVLAAKLRSPLKWLRNGPAPIRTSEDFWALKDVSFEVKPGEVVGIIGRNGAGKSTLLKILSRITEPTKGRVTLNGRVASLLEVGTGFHPELTGRENIFLNGAILGMARPEIRRKFDEIVAFAEVEKFLDTPVKRYSSGMYVRLAFAVAAYLEPEILIVDEVLAVGDAEFQKKCLGRMGEVAKGGRTVLFVTHNMAAVNRLCGSGIVLEGGRVVFAGRTVEAVACYSATAGLTQARRGHVLYDASSRAATTDRVRVERIETLGGDGAPHALTRTWDRLVLRVHGWCAQPTPHAAVELEIGSSSGDRLLQLSTQPDSDYPLSLPQGPWAVDCRIDELPLAAGEYSVGVNITRPNIEYLWQGRDLAVLSVSPRDVFNSGMAPISARGPVVLRHSWQLVAAPDERAAFATSAMMAAH